MKNRDIISIVLLFAFLHLFVGLKVQQIDNKSSAFYQIISKCVENFDSIRYLGSENNRENAYIIKIIEYENDFKKITFSISDIINGNTLTNLKPFYYTFVGDKMVILSASTIPDTSLLGKMFYVNDSTFKEKTKCRYLVFDFNNYPIMHRPILGLYSTKFIKRNRIGKVRYLTIDPIGLAPLKYWPITEYNIDDKLDKYYYVFSDGEIPLRGKGLFDKRQSLEELYDHEFEIKFSKVQK